MRKEKRVVRDAKVLTAFINVYCRENHGGLELCEECRGVLEYALRRNGKCPLDPKPKCKAGLVVALFLVI